MRKLQSKVELLGESSKTQEILNDIRNLSNILSHDEKQELDTVCDKFDDWDARLSDNRYRVAIIGTEKAGKSTFANALLRRNFLPEDEGRCTFTTTTIESSKTEDTAEIEFFTKQEFIDKFNSLCEEIEFTCNYNTVAISELNEFCDNTSSAIATSNAVDDIRDIIEKKEQIEKYLSGNIKTFTGQDIDNIKSYITDEIKARAVKNITIKSTQFKEQENLIIYDVPGFDSPTKLHLEQAKWYMRNADIVIMLVSIADRISFVKAQADFLNDTKDRYGQKLSNKLIVVASKFDKHIVDDKNSSDIKIEKSYQILSDELKKYGLYKENNIFKASSLGFLEKEDIVNTQYAYPNLKKHEYFDGIETIEARLEEFLNGEALEILNENFNIDQLEAQALILNFKRDYNPKRDEKKKRSEEIALIDNKWDLIKKNIKLSLTKYQEVIKTTQFDFNETISSKVTNDWIEDLITELPDDLEEAKSELVGGRALVEQATIVNDKIRAKLWKKSLDKIVNISTDTITIENGNKQDEIIDIVSEIIFTTKTITNEEKNELANELNFITNDFKYDAKSYRPLILRFLNNVFEILILNRITNDENDSRVARFKTLKTDIEVLLNYSDYDDTLGFYNQPFIKQLLIQDTSYLVKEANIQNLLKGAKVSTKYDEVIKEISNDLNSLGDIFNNILLKAIDVESPFKASLNDQIQAILADVDETSKSNIRGYLIDHIESVARTEYSRLSIDQNLAKKIENIIYKINF